ncbi:hypothetical protein ACFLUZ_02975 [Chloroflexota bacterium]
MSDKIILPKSEIEELHNKLNDNWVSDEEKERIKAILSNCKLDPEEKMFDFNPLHVLYGLWILITLPFGFLWLGIKKLVGKSR